MTNLLHNIPYLSLLLEFILASSLLLGGVWLVEKLGLLKNPTIAELTWKMAILASFLVLLPSTGLKPTTITLAPAQDIIETFDMPVITSKKIRPEAGLTLTETPITTGQYDTRRSVHSPVRENKIVVDTTDPKGRAADSLLAPKRSSKEKSPVTNTRLTTPAIETETVTANNIPEHDSGILPKSAQQALASIYTKLTGSFSLSGVVAFLWFSFAGASLLLLMYKYRKAVKAIGIRRKVDVVSAPTLALRDICSNAGIKKMPSLSQSSRLKSPVCLPGREICLPHWVLEKLPEAELRSLLAHELGHLVRRDPMMLIILQFLTRLFFFQPLFKIAQKRLLDLAELSADEWAARQTADSRAVANALYTCASKIQTSRQTEWGLAMAGNKSILKRRIERLLNAQTEPFKTVGRPAKLLLGVSILSLSLGMPAIEIADAASVDIKEEGIVPKPYKKADTLRATTPPAPVAFVPKTEFSAQKQNRHDIDFVPDVEFVPAVEFVPSSQTDHPKTIFMTATMTSTSPSISFTSSVNTPTKMLASTAPMPPAPEMTSHSAHTQKNTINIVEDNTNLSATWDGTFGFSDDGKSIIPTSNNGSFRLQEIEGGEKSEYILIVKNGDTTESFYENGKAVTATKEQKKWRTDMVKRLTRSGFAAEERVAQLYKKGGANAVLNATTKLDSDHTQSVYLIALMDTAKLSEKEMKHIINVAADFDSDFTANTVLKRLMEEQNSHKVAPAVLSVVEKMESDFERRQLMISVIEHAPLKGKTFDAFIDVAHSFDSDYELKSVLSEATEKQELSSNDYLQLVTFGAETIDSDYEIRSFFDTAINRKDLTDKEWRTLIEACDTIDSDYERQTLLSHMAHIIGDNTKLMNALTEAGYDPDRMAPQSPTSHAANIYWDSEKFDKGLNTMMRALDENMAQLEKELQDIDIDGVVIEALNKSKQKLTLQIQDLDSKGYSEEVKETVRDALQDAIHDIDDQLQAAREGQHDFTINKQEIRETLQLEKQKARQEAEKIWRDAQLKAIQEKRAEHQRAMDSRQYAQSEATEQVRAIRAEAVALSERIKAEAREEAKRLQEQGRRINNEARARAQELKREQNAHKRLKLKEHQKELEEREIELEDAV